MPRAKLDRPSASFFEALKREEHRQFPFRKRLRTNYQQNCSAANELDCTTTQLRKNYKSEKALLSIASNHIVEHANRRVDLFFYTLIAYYNKRLNPMSGHTDLQHGKGRHVTGNIIATVGCHSSFTPSLLDENIYSNSSLPPRKSLIYHTHLMDSLNATMELPIFVNEFDVLLEGLCRPKCMGILTEVSYGKINPIEGLTLFLSMMDEVLKNLQKKAEHNMHLGVGKHAFFTNPSLNQHLIDLVKKGTLSTSYDSWSETVSDEYLQMLLRLTPEKVKLCNNSSVKGRAYEEAMVKIQEEILNSESEVLNRA